MRADTVNHFPKIMRGHVGGHSDSDARAPIDQQVGKGGRKDGWFGAGFIIIRNKIDRFLIHVLHERRAQMSQPRFGIAHGRGRVALDRTEVSLSVHQRLPHRPGLRHVDQRRINHRLAVRMIIAARIPANLGALAVLPVGIQGQILHGKQDAPLRRLQPVPHVRQGAGYNHRHRVIQK